METWIVPGQILRATNWASMIQHSQPLWETSTVNSKVLQHREDKAMASKQYREEKLETPVCVCVCGGGGGGDKVLCVQCVVCGIGNGKVLSLVLLGISIGTQFAVAQSTASKTRQVGAGAGIMDGS